MVNKANKETTNCIPPYTVFIGIGVKVLHTQKFYQTLEGCVGFIYQYYRVYGNEIDQAYAIDIKGHCIDLLEWTYQQVISGHKRKIRKLLRLIHQQQKVEK